MLSALTGLSGYPVLPCAPAGLALVSLAVVGRTGARPAAGPAM